jgi:hypothetical protein
MILVKEKKVVLIFLKIILLLGIHLDLIRKTQNNVKIYKPSKFELGSAQIN